MIYISDGQTPVAFYYEHIDNGMLYFNQRIPLCQKFSHKNKSVNMITALVNYYGAVGADCEQPALAYDFLREFLTEDSQWEIDITSLADNFLRDLPFHPGES